MANLKISLPISKIKASKEEKNKKSFLSFITTLVRACESFFLFVQDWKGFKEIVSHELRWYLLLLLIFTSTIPSAAFYQLSRDWKSNQITIAEFDTSAFISVIHQDFVAFIHQGFSDPDRSKQGLLHP